MTWDITEHMLLSRMRAAGHVIEDVLPEGMATCLHCGSVWHISKRALAARGEATWGVDNDRTKDPLHFNPCTRKSIR